MATISKRGKNQYQVKVRKRGFPAISKTFPTAREADSWGHEKEASMRNRDFVDLRVASSILFEEALIRYRDTVAINHKGKDSEIIRINKMLADPISSYSLETLLPPVLIDYRDRRLAKVSAATVRRELDLISQIFSTAILDWQVPLRANPVKLIRRIPPAKERERRLRSNEEDRLRQYLAEGDRTADGTFTTGTRNPWVLPLFDLSIETSARRSELLTTLWSDVHFEERYIWKAETKNGSARAITLSKKALITLQNLKALHDDLAAKSAARNRPYTDMRVFKTTDNAVKKAFKRAIAKLEIQNLRWHDLRHEAISRAAKKIPHEVALSKFSGHKDPRQLRRYYHPDPSDLAEMLDA
ncbi:MAG: site-specific integrase [Rhodocyclaceae bacterium]|nr:site-specific integrase [Rhodocyclaceae bacterium]